MPNETNNKQTSNTGAVISDHTSTPPPTSSEPSSTTNNPAQNDPLNQDDRVTSQDSNNMTKQVLSDAQSGNKGGNKKMIATIFGVLFLIGGVAAGVFLVQRQQNLQEKAASGSECDQAPDCVLFEDPGNAGSDTVTQDIKYLDITAQEYHRYYPGNTDDGCYRVAIQGRDFTWQRIGDGPDCKDVSNIQVWMGEEETPQLSASCSEIMAYDEDWNRLSTSQLEQLDPGQTIKLAVEGTTDDGTIDKARFRVNSSEWQEATDLKPGEASTYYINYTVPEDTNNFTVNAQVHLSENDSWY